MLDIVSYILGKRGQSVNDIAVIGDIVCTDDGNGNITITWDGDTHLQEGVNDNG